MLSRLVIQKNKKSNMHKIVAFGFIALNVLFLQPSPTLAQNSPDSERIAEIFTGRWSGYFPCGPNLYTLEYSVSGNDLIQTVISNGGENCLPNGNVSIVAKIPDDVSIGSSFTSTISLGTGGETIETQIRIIDVNTVEYDGVTLSRVRQDSRRSAEIFTGRWSGYFPCGPNLYTLEYSVSGNDLIQTVISNGGENCLPNGNVSTVAKIPDDVSIGSSFTSTISLGTGGETIETQIRIIDVNTLEYGGVTLNRVQQ